MLPSPGSSGRWIGAPSPTSGPVPAHKLNLDPGAGMHVGGLVALHSSLREGDGSNSAEEAGSQSVM